MIGYYIIANMPRGFNASSIYATRMVQNWITVILKHAVNFNSACFTMILNYDLRYIKALKKFKICYILIII